MNLQILSRYEYFLRRSRGNNKAVRAITKKKFWEEIIAYFT
jgi:hypothetical protein